MTIRSLDMQVLVQKVGDVARVQQAQQTESNSRQQEFLQAIDQQTKERSKAVKETEKNESAFVHGKEEQEKEKKAKKKSKGKGKKRKKENKENKENKESSLAKDRIKGNNIDFTV